MTENATVETGHRKGKDTTVQALKNGVTESIEDTVGAAQETAKQVADQATDEFRKMSESGTKFVRDNPGVAVAGALGVGILVGLVLRGRD